MPGVVVPRGSTYLNTENGLTPAVDALGQAVAARAQYQGTLSGLAPALQQSGIPVSAPPGILGGLLSKFGIGSSDTPPAMPVAGASPTMTTAGQGAPVSAPNQGGMSTPAQPTQAMAYASGGSGTPSGDGLIPAIAQIAQKNGIDPMVALRAVQGESKGNPGAVGDNGSSFGLLQMHYGGMAPGGNSVAGMGDDYTAATGRDARDPANALDALDYALGRVAKEGWGAFHGATKAGIGAWQGISGGRGGQAPAMPSQATAYAPSSDGTPMMPQASASGPQPSQGVALGSSNTPGAAPSANGQGGSTASPGQVISTLMQNPATRQIGGRLWQGAVQQGGGMPGTMTLPAGMTPEALATMISTPATQQMGLAVWQRAMFPEVHAFKPGDYLVRGTQPMGQVPSPLQHVESGRDDYGQPTYGAFNPMSGVTTPDARTASAPGGFAGPDGPNPSLPSGPDFLKTLAPGLQAQVQAYADGRMKLPTGQSASSPMAQRMRQFVLQYDPTFDATNTDARFETRKDFATGKAAQSINSGNTAVQHGADLSDAAEALGNGQVPLLNKLKQAYGDQTGGNIPGKEFAGALNDFADEVVRFYRNSGGTESDIAAVRSALDPSQSPDQLRAGITQQVRLIAGKTSAYQNQWHQGMGPLASDYPILSSDTQAALDRINARPPSVSSYPPKGAVGNSSTSLPLAAPAGSIPTLTDPAQMQALPPGSRFRTPDGQLRVRH